MVKETSAENGARGLNRLLLELLDGGGEVGAALVLARGCDSANADGSGPLENLSTISGKIRRVLRAHRGRMLGHARGRMGLRCLLGHGPVARLGGVLEVDQLPVE